MAHDDLRTRFPEASLKLDEHQVRIVERFAKLRAFKSGQTIIAAGTRDPNFYVVKTGEVEAIEYSSGKPQVIWKSLHKSCSGMCRSSLATLRTSLGLPWATSKCSR